MNVNWPTSKLRDVAEVRVSNVDKKSYATERPIKLCNYMDVYANDYVTSALDFMPATASSSEVERFSLHAGDVVITKDSETPDDIGVPAVIVEDIDGLVCGYHLALIRPKASMHPTFLAKQLASAPTIKYFAANATGSTRFGLAIGTIEKLDIPTPPIREQSKIAEVLSTVDRAIEQTEALIAKQQRIKTGLMQDLLTRGIDEHGNLRSEQTHEFKDSPLGRIPVEWEPLPLGSCGQRFSGGTPSKAIPRFWGGGVPWVCPKDMKQFELHQSIDTITGDAVAAGARLMPTGTVFIVIRGMILAHTFPVGVSTTEVAFNQDVKAIVPKQGLMGRYLAYWLSSHSHQFLKLATTATHGTKRFDMDELQAALVGVPLPNEQKQIVTIFDEQQSIIERLQGLTAKLQAEKRGLMQGPAFRRSSGNHALGKRESGSGRVNISEDSFVSWSRGPGQTEADKCSNAETAVRKAIKASEELSALNISVFAQGSYRARTNVRQNSDVDICVRYDSAFFPDYPEGTTQETFGNVDGTLPFSKFKNMVQTALEDYFGKAGVTRGSKAFDVHANTYRIDADVVPTFEHRRYTGGKNSDGNHRYLSGVAFNPDSGGLIINWPEQTYSNGVDRNTATGRKYKRAVRILKRLRDKMQDDDVAIAKKTPSFLIECLVWNTDVDAFSKDTYTAVVRHILADLWNRTRKDDDCSEWGEVNELKYLFRPAQPWTRLEANEFLQAAWDYIGYQ